MYIELKKFGTILTSRQSGREAYAAFRPRSAELGPTEDLIINFDEVIVLTPSWADEFLTPLHTGLGERLKLEPSDNASVKLTIETLEDILKQKFRLA